MPSPSQNKEISYNKRWKHKWVLLKWQQKIPAHGFHATMKTITDNVTASSYSCRTIICILPPCPAYVMEMPGVKFEQHKCLLTKQSSSESPGTQSSFLQWIAIEKVDEQKCFSCLLVIQPSVKEQNVFLNTKISRKPPEEGPTTHSLTAEEESDDKEVDRHTTESQGHILSNWHLSFISLFPFKGEMNVKYHHGDCSCLFGIPRHNQRNTVLHRWYFPSGQWNTMQMQTVAH